MGWVERRTKGMPGNLISHIRPRHLAGAIVLACLLVPGIAAATDAGASSGTDYSQSDPVPTWCHKNLQVLSQLTNWRGYRDGTLLKRKFSQLFSAPTYYRGYVADRNIFAFSAEIDRDNPHVDLEEFVVPAGEFNPGGPVPRGSAISVGRRGSTFETLVWNIVDFGLLAIRASNPTTVVRHDQITLDVIPYDLHAEFVGNQYTLYTVNGLDSIRVYTLPFTNWVIAEERGILDTPGDASAVAFQDSRLFVADGSEGVQIVDASDIDNLEWVGHTDTRGPAKHVALMDTLLFVAEWDEGVEIFSVADVDSIRLLAWVDTPGLAHEVAPDSSHLFYVADWDGGLRVYDYARMDSIFLDGFYGIGSQYHSVSVMDSIVFAGDHSGFMMFRYGDDREAPDLAVTVTQNSFLRKYLRTYVLASECLEDVPTVRHLVLPRQTGIEDFEGYADSDTLRMHWNSVVPEDTVSVSSTAFEGDQALQFDFTLPELVTRWVSYSFEEAQDWRLFDQMAFHFRTGGDEILGSVRAGLISADGDSLLGEGAEIGADWQEYALDLTPMDPRDEIETILLGVTASVEDTTVFGTLLADRVVLKRVNPAEPTKGYTEAFLGDTLDVDVSTVSDERSLYAGDFELVASDSGMTNAILVTATDYSGNATTQMKEYRAQLVVPEKGGSLWSPSSRLSLHVPPAATGEEAFFYIIPEKSADASTIPAGARVLSRSYVVGSSARDVRNDVEVAFRMDRVPADVAPEELGVYRQDGDSWLYVGGRYDSETRTVRVRTADLGTFAVMASPHRPETPRPDRVVLQSHPNPFNPNTTISYACPARSRVSLRIYDVGGRLVKTLVDDARDAGVHYVTWNGRGDTGVPATSGIYFARLEVDREIQTIKLVLIR
jgi:hypothetical protein